MWDGRAEAVRRDVAALAAAGLGVAELHAAAIELVDRVVPADLTCWASLDPDTAVISSMTSGRARIPGAYEPLLATYEYDGAQPHTFAELARRPVPAARLSDLPRRAVERSGRFAEVWRPLGLGHELRVVRDAHGGWIVLHAGRLVAGEDDGETVVTVDRASGTELLGVLLAAYGLTARERDVCHEVLAGLSTVDIAARLAISAHTVQDHLKSVFGKVGVRSRGELTAKLLS
ncbi:helix-turn-helix transcriptional regulator [Amycolatopsis vancoresmycina]|uniref:helix-turn-helix transcriptional regulator n=1 Tax=Amycolatopsis vancoresmycina TaxID=208444 RepID=UPI000527D978|nr:helix-turn-helix transcriptional regulator [Amycolatopsis vancoresmycina]